MLMTYTYHLAYYAYVCIYNYAYVCLLCLCVLTMLMCAYYAYYAYCVKIIMCKNCKVTSRLYAAIAFPHAGFAAP